MNFITNINILFANYIVLGLDFTSSDVSNYVTEASGNTPSVITSEPIPLNEWVNVVAVADAAAQRFFFIIYLFILSFISLFLHFSVAINIYSLSFAAWNSISTVLS